MPESRGPRPRARPARPGAGQRRRARRRLGRWCAATPRAGAAPRCSARCAAGAGAASPRSSPGSCARRRRCCRCASSARARSRPATRRSSALSARCSARCSSWRSSSRSGLGYGAARRRPAAAALDGDAVLRRAGRGRAGRPLRRAPVPRRSGCCCRPRAWAGSRWSPTPAWPTAQLIAPLIVAGRRHLDGLPGRAELGGRLGARRRRSARRRAPTARCASSAACSGSRSASPCSPAPAATPRRPSSATASSPRWPCRAGLSLLAATAGALLPAREALLPVGAAVQEGDHHAVPRAARDSQITPARATAVRRSTADPPATWGRCHARTRRERRARTVPRASPPDTRRVRVPAARGAGRPEYWPAGPTAYVNGAQKSRSPRSRRRPRARRRPRPRGRRVRTVGDVALAGAGHAPLALDVRGDLPHRRPERPQHRHPAGGDVPHTGGDRAPGPRDARHLAHPAIGIAHEADDKRGERGVELPVRPGQRFRHPLADVGARVALAARRHELRRRIDRRDVRSAEACDELRVSPPGPQPTSTTRLPGVTRAASARAAASDGA